VKQATRYYISINLALTGCSIRYLTNTPTPSIGDCYITGFNQGGICLVNSAGQINDVTIESSGSYGILMSGSSTELNASTKNLIKQNTYGMYLTSSSSPTVRKTKFEQNTSRGVRVDAGSYPDFGTNTPNGAGNNSFIKTNPPMVYYHIYNYNASNINAINNYWSPLGYVYHVNYIPYLASDPLRRLEATIVPLAEDLALAISYPNPFNPTVTISFNLASTQSVSAKIYNIMGQEIKELFNGTKAGGTTNLIWDGKDMNGRPVSTGVYFCSIQTETKQQTVKLTMLK
jgi:parallel beta-helix repeat protein